MAKATKAARGATTKRAKPKAGTKPAATPKGEPKAGTVRAAKAKPKAGTKPAATPKAKAKPAAGAARAATPKAGGTAARGTKARDRGAATKRAEPAAGGDEALEALRAFAREAAPRADDDDDPDGTWKLRVEIDRASDGSIDVRSHGWHASALLDRLFAALARPALAARLRSLRLTAKDAGTNGTREWNLATLLGRQGFPALRTLYIEGTLDADHNRTIMGGYDDEGAQLGKLIALAPALTELWAPSPPGAAFFQGPAHPLASLVLQTGYGHVDFVANLAASRRFTQLASLDFTDYAETYMTGWEALRVPAAHYDALFQNAEGLPSLRTLVLRGTALTSADVARMREAPVGQQLERFDVLPLSEGSAFGTRPHAQRG